MVDKWRLAYLQALGGMCVKCGETRLEELEAHDISGEHHGYHNKQRKQDIIDFKEKGIIHSGRYILCKRCHIYEHGNAFMRVKMDREDEIKQLEKEQAFKKQWKEQQSETTES